MVRKRTEKVKLYTVVKDQPYIKDSDLQIYEPLSGFEEEDHSRIEGQDLLILEELYKRSKKTEI